MRRRPRGEPGGPSGTGLVEGEFRTFAAARDSDWVDGLISLPSPIPSSSPLGRCAYDRVGFLSGPGGLLPVSSSTRALDSPTRLW
jgi:hypothetical protein